RDSIGERKPSSMRHSTDRILVSHAGNLPRPDDLNEAIAKQDQDEFQRLLPQAVNDIVDRQIELGVDVLKDGEFPKAGSYGGYIVSRVTGFEHRPADENTPRKRGGTA